jgi:putative RecB family exonuclease
VDYKTGKSPSPAFEAKAMFQMRFYALAWWRLTEEVPTQLQLMYLGNREFVRYAPTTDDLIATERKILAIRDAISRAGDQQDFKATPSRLCSWCDFKQFCPEFGGVVPPLPPKSEWLSGSSRVTVALHSAITTAQQTKTPVQEGSI